MVLEGKIVEDVLERASKIKEGENLLSVVEELESMVLKKGDLAFPINLSKDRIAAHYTPSKEEKGVTSGVLKVDVGAMVDGNIADAAITIDYTGEYGKMMDAGIEALQNAISTIRPGISVGKIGEIIESTVEKYGFKVISNLSGHALYPYILHGGSIPNTGGTDGWEIKEGMRLAIEPFVTNGIGYVKEGNITNIFSFKKKVAVRNPIGRKILEYAQKDRKGLPFAERWLDYPLLPLRMALKELWERDAIIGYPILIEKGIVVQFETTVIVEKDGAVPIVRKPLNL